MSLTANDVLGESGRTIEEVQKERKEYVKNIGVEYRYGCYEEKRSDSCHLLADYREAIELNLKAAFKLYEENCKLRSYPKSCFKYARYLIAGKECETDIAKAIEPLKIACDAKIAPACKLLALAYWTGKEDRPPDPEKAEKYQKIACNLDEPEACWILSTWYMGPNAKFKKIPGENKKGLIKPSLPRDMDKAIEYGIRACDLNVYQSCANVSRIFKLGDGVPKNVEKQKEYYEKAREIVENMRKGINPEFTA